MSKQNKANRNNYMQAGRLTPDDMARERMKQRKPVANPAPRERFMNRAPGQPRQRDEQESTGRESEREESE
jgi:hypothetical protein